MNKEVLINKLSEKLEASEIEVKIVYDLFLNKIADFIEENNAIKIHDLGVFRIKRNDGTLAEIITNDQQLESDLYYLIFYPENSDDVIPYHINYHPKNDEDLLKNAFNLNTSVNMIPVAGGELKDDSNYLELQQKYDAKIEELLNSSIQIENLDALDKIKDSESLNDQDEISEDEITAAVDDDESLSNNDSDPGHYEVEEKVEEEEIPWDFTPNFSEEEIVENEDNNSSENIEEEFNYDEEQEVIIDSDNTDENDIIINDDVEEENLIEDELESSDIVDEEDQENLIDNKVYEETDEIQEELVEENSESIEQTDFSENPKEEDKLQTEGIVEDEVPTEEKLFSKKNKNKYKFLEDIEDAESKVKFPRWYWIVATLFIVFTTAGIYIFFFNSSDEAGSPEPVLIERNYDVPVSVIPESEDITADGNENEFTETLEPKDEELKLSQKTVPQERNLNAGKQENLKNEPVQTKKQTENTKISNDEITLVEDDKNILVKDFIFGNGSEFTIQLSSWKSRPKAESEVQRLRNNGLDAYLTWLERSDGTWYRVRVGTYRSLQEAENQLKKIK